MGSFRISFSRELTAASLWDFGEDHLMNRAMQMTVEDLNRVQELAAQYEDPSYPLPDPGQRVSHGHVIAYAAVTHFEGRLRPLVRGRRRPKANRPPELAELEES